jgi:hypothetical protein
MAKGHDWLPTLAIVGGTAGLIVADPHAMPYFRTHARSLDDVNDTFDAPITTPEVIALPTSLLVAGCVRRASYQVATALLAGERLRPTARSLISWSRRLPQKTSCGGKTRNSLH